MGYEEQSVSHARTHPQSATITMIVDMREGIAMRFVHLIIGIIFCCGVGGCFVPGPRTGNVFLSTRQNIKWMMTTPSGPNMVAGLSVIVNPFIYIGTFTTAPIWDILCLPSDIWISINEGTKIVVLDDSYIPIEDAQIRIRDHHLVFSQKGRTSRAGICSTGVKLSAVSLANVSVHKNGYYPLNSLWRPSDGGNPNVQTSILSKVECPIDLKFNEERLLECFNVIWRESKDYGWLSVKKQKNQVEYDFIVGDWMPPYGKGKESDAIFFFEEKDKESFIRVEFLGKGNGIVKARRKQGTGVLMKSAPLEGYHQQYTITKGGVGDQMGAYFKVRGGFYGKICNDINLEEDLRNEKLEIKSKIMTRHYPDGQWRKKNNIQIFYKHQ